MQIKDKVFVITGGANGIGKEMVLLLLKKGAKVAAIDINENALNELKDLAKDYKDSLTTHVCDITNLEMVEKLPKTIIKKFGQVDGVLNVAGIIQPFVTVNELDYERIQRVMNINFYGALYMVKSFLPHLLGRQETCIISNVSSMGGFMPFPGQAVYGASKAAVKLLTESLYAELKNTNVRVNIVFPGAVATNITKNSGVETKASGDAKGFKMLSAPEAAELIIKGIEKEKFRTVVGKDSKAMDFLYRLNPKKAVDMITKKMKDFI